MKTLAVTLIALGLASTPARADGFNCHAKKTSLDVKVYNHRDPALGTKKAAVMVISNPSNEAGKHTIGRFSDTQGTLTNAAAHFTAVIGDADHEGPADVDIDMIGLDGVSTIDLDIRFVYGTPSDPDKTFDGDLTLNKTDGTRDVIEMDCKRYLVN